MPQLSLPSSRHNTQSLGLFLQGQSSRSRNMSCGHRRDEPQARSLDILFSVRSSTDALWSSLTATRTDTWDEIRHQGVGRMLDPYWLWLCTHRSLPPLHRVQHVGTSGRGVYVPYTQGKWEGSWVPTW